MSNQEIEKLYAKKKSYTIPKEPKEGFEQITVEITPLSMDDMGLVNMNKDMPMSEISKNMTKILAVSLDQSEEVVGKISLQVMEELLNAVLDANDFNVEDAKKTGIKDFLAKKNSQIKEKAENPKNESS